PRWSSISASSAVSSTVFVSPLNRPPGPTSCTPSLRARSTSPFASCSSAEGSTIGVISSDTTSSLPPATRPASQALVVPPLAGQSLGNRPSGLPQNFAPSDALSELYIGWVERRLSRANIPTYRHNDDFRLGAETWGGGLRSLERLGEELSAVGLELK